MSLSKITGKWVIVLIVFYELFLFGCETETPQPQKKITIVDIPDTYNNYYYARVSFSKNKTILARSNDGKIKGNKVKLKMYYRDNMANEFAGSGTYEIILQLFVDHTTMARLWSGNIDSLTITDESTTISFNDFNKLE
jgi:hypothetical protein